MMSISCPPFDILFRLPYEIGFDCIVARRDTAIPPYADEAPFDAQLARFYQLFSAHRHSMASAQVAAFMQKFDEADRMKKGNIDFPTFQGAYRPNPEHPGRADC
jgi:hypothetical protein